MQRLLDRYVMRQMAGACAIIALTLAGVLLMTQSLRFMELIIESGASGLAFITLSLLALPRFFEVILPIALAAGTMFVYARLRKDGEITVMQAAGMTPAAITRPGFMFSLVVMAMLFVIMAWIAPMTLAHMNQLRQVIKAQYSSLLFREGVFNSVGDDVTVYVAERTADGSLSGLMVYDARPENPRPVTILARHGNLVATDKGQQVVVYNGIRQILNPNTGALERLNFERYIIDLPDAAPVQQRWAEPEERTIDQLIFPSPDDEQAKKNKRDFLIELNRRIISPLLAPCFFMVTMALMLLTPFKRTRSGWDMAWSGGILLLLQSLYLGSFGLARSSLAGIGAMYLIVIVPLMLAVYLIERASRVENRDRGVA